MNKKLLFCNICSIAVGQTEKKAVNESVAQLVSGTLMQTFCGGPSMT